MAEGTGGLGDALTRGVADLFPASEPSLAARLAEAKQAGRPLRIKLGIDPTGVDIHLG
ncbi:MAG: tyrosine--tRNA ligase, partial [Synechococcaceae bacterium WB9_2_170]|nr:tyrosine--tRNA ligase [Synechococcaceae bacterium WB9_2_170]